LKGGLAKRLVDARASSIDARARIVRDGAWDAFGGREVVEVAYNGDELRLTFV